MTRQFFVGGNFKMNPVSREAKRVLVKTLNEATLDPQVGEHSSRLLIFIMHIRSQRSSSLPLPCT